MKVVPYHFYEQSCQAKLVLIIQSTQLPNGFCQIYQVVRSLAYIHDSKRDRFQSGDLLFVAAGTEYKFKDITEDLALWRVFYGPHGGEVPA